MYCPECGQVQPREVRYCSRCGLSLQEVGLWLAGAGELVNPQAGNKQISPRRKNIMRAAKVAFFAGVLTPIGFIIGEADRNPAWVVPPLLILFASLVWMLYCRLFMEKSVAPDSKNKPLFRAEDTNYLPPRKALELEPPRANTSEIIQPGSVTEYTTNLLKNRK